MHHSEKPAIISNTEIFFGFENVIEIKNDRKQGDLGQLSTISFSK